MAYFCIFCSPSDPTCWSMRVILTEFLAFFNINFFSSFCVKVTKKNYDIFWHIRESGLIFKMWVTSPFYALSSVILDSCKISTQVKIFVKKVSNLGPKFGSHLAQVKQHLTCNIQLSINLKPYKGNHNQIRTPKWTCNSKNEQKLEASN